MADTTMITVRLDNSVLERIDAYAAQKTEELKGMTISRTDAVKMILAFGLDSEEFGQSEIRPAKKKVTKKR